MESLSDFTDAICEVLSFFLYLRSDVRKFLPILPDQEGAVGQVSQIPARCGDVRFGALEFFLLTRQKRKT
jgi:hypothetical protein